MTGSQSVPAGVAPRQFDVGSTGERIEQLLAEFGESGGESARRAEELVRVLVGLYGAGLARIVATAQQAGVLDQLTGDSLVSSLLVVHDLHPLSTSERIAIALDEIRPYLGSHAGGVEFLGVDDEGVLRLRLEGTCNGCPSSTVTAKISIENAVRRAAPEITRVEVEGVVEAGEEVVPAGAKLLQIQPTPRHVASRVPQLPMSELECPVPAVHP
jgi:Fe-S cluster biogenesis protein NfuA